MIDNIRQYMSYKIGHVYITTLKTSHFPNSASKTPICKQVCKMQKREPEQLPDPWLFDSESLLRELDRCRELVLEISIAHPHQTHFDINIAVNALWNRSVRKS